MDLIIVCLYIRALFFAILIIWFLYQVLKKKRWVRWERAARDMKDFIKRNEKRIWRAKRNKFYIPFWSVLKDICKMCSTPQGIIYHIRFSIHFTPLLMNPPFPAI